jgi:hypothetical protein
MVFAVGWDPALETYFAQVMDYTISRADDRVIVWAGGMPPHYRDLDEMLCFVNSRLSSRLRSFTIRGSMRARLEKEFRLHRG